jgi:hypothetical protein
LWCRVLWNTEENTYYELYSKKHICPNIATYNKESAIIPPTAATRIKSKMGNSLVFARLSSYNQKTI